MDIEIVETTDCDELAALNEPIQAWHHQNFPDDFKPFNAYEISKAFKNLLTNRDCFALVAKSDGESIGYLVGIMKSRPESAFQYEKTILEIDQIAVVSGYRKLGVGKRLLDAACLRAREKGISEIQLNHWAGNELAENFFGKNGFVYFNYRMRK